MSKASLEPRGKRTPWKAPLAIAFLALIFSIALSAQTTKTDDEAEPEVQSASLVEIYRIVPGKHREFLEFVAFLDEVNIKAGLPPRELYVHRDGADWDFILIQPSSIPDELRDAYNQAWDESGAPSGADFFFHIRHMISEHSDTFTTGPTTAQAFLSGASPKSEQVDSR